MPAKFKALTTEQYQALATGLQTYCPSTVFTVGEKAYTVTQLNALITTILAAAIAVPPAKAAWLAAVAASRAAEESDGETVKEAREVVALMFKTNPTTLAAFAISPRKSPAPLSAEARAAANAKAKATRAARGTTSKKQKALITGNVAGVNIVPFTTTTVPAPTAVAPATPPAVVSVNGAAPHS